MALRTMTFPSEHPSRSRNRLGCASLQEYSDGRPSCLSQRGRAGGGWWPTGPDTYGKTKRVMGVKYTEPVPLSSSH